MEGGKRFTSLMWNVTADCLVLWIVFSTITLQQGTVNYREVGFSYIGVTVFLTILGVHQMHCKEKKNPLNLAEIANLIYLNDDTVGWVKEDYLGNPVISQVALLKWT